MLHRAQETLARKMGSLLKDQFKAKDVLKDYLAMFTGPLPQEAIAALSQLFKLDCQLMTQADDALTALEVQDTPAPQERDSEGTPPAFPPSPALASPAGAIVVAT